VYRSNIFAVNFIAEILKTSLGPKGMGKLIFDEYGGLSFTKDGCKILGELEVVHPAAKLMVELVKNHVKEVGDGVKRSIILVGSFLKKAEKLLIEDIHPSSIVEGYGKALNFCLNLLEKFRIPVNFEDEKFLCKVASSTLASRIQQPLDKMAWLAVKAIKGVMEKENGKILVDVEGRILIRKKEGGGVDDSKIVNGVIINKGVAHPSMPKKVENAKILILNQKLYLEKKFKDFDAFIPQFTIKKPEELKNFLGKNRLSRVWLEKIKELGVNVVVNLFGVEPSLEEALAREGVMVVKRADKEAFNLLPLACGGRVVGNLEDATHDCLGWAKNVEERKVGGGVKADLMVFVEGCLNPKAVSILLRGASWEIVEEYSCALKNSLHAVANALKANGVLAGGGAWEVELALNLYNHALTLPSRMQLAVKAYAEALNEIPKTLILNSGLNPVEVLHEITSKHEDGNWRVGFNCLSSKVEDVVDAGIFDVLSVVKQILKSATETANMILRIDKVYKG
ncbi:MAG: thermosome subunit, partial [Candidatus Bathyarchaeota archaeon]|nr:thermosome subunit [Candidatus Bathyarchaeota archaeon]